MVEHRAFYNIIQILNYETSSFKVPKFVQDLHYSQRLQNSSRRNNYTAHALLAHTHSQQDGRQNCSFLCSYVLKNAQQAVWLRYGVSKRKEKKAGSPVFILSLGDPVAISKMNVPLGSGGRVLWQSLEKWTRKASIVAQVLRVRRKRKKQRKWGERNGIRNHQTLVSLKEVMTE
jgi:hypothetical protein